MDMFEKLTVLADAAKYDVSCASSGTERKNTMGGIGNAAACGICHSFAADGRCISLLKVLMTNYCVYDCKYCVNRKSNEVKRAAFTPLEIAELTINFYRRNYIEGLFLSSGVIRNPDYTSEQLIEALSILRHQFRFNGYIHVKAIPGADADLITRLGLLADRISVNIELPSESSLKLLAPDKTKESIILPMGIIKNGIIENKEALTKYRNAPSFTPSGQSTQMIIGATDDTDMKIITLSENLYQKYKMKRVYYSAYMPVVEHSLLPSVDIKPPLLREHRLYQADWLLRFYGFRASELLDERNPNFNPLIDPKCNWAVNHLELFPLEINKAPLEMLLRVPGIGVTSAKRIVMARRNCTIDFSGLKKLGAVIKRAQYFVTCGGKTAEGLKLTSENVLMGLLSDKSMQMIEGNNYIQTSMFDNSFITREDVLGCLTGQM